MENYHMLKFIARLFGYGHTFHYQPTLLGVSLEK
jgi:hypothetical protein